MAVTPELLMFGYTVDKDAMLKEIITYNSPEDYVQKLQEKRDKIALYHVKARDKKNDATRAYANKHRREVTFQTGEKVLLRNNATSVGGGNALNHKFVGPYRVLKADNVRQKCLLKDLDSGKTRDAHFIHLKKIFRFEIFRITWSVVGMESGLSPVRKSPVFCENQSPDS